MVWLYLAVSSVFEVGWLISLRETHGFTRVIPIIFYAIFGAGSAFFLSKSMQRVPMVTAYSVWIGGAMVGSIVAEALIFRQPVKPAVFVCIALVAIGVTGIKVFTRI